MTQPNPTSNETLRSANRIIGDFTYLLGYDKPDLYEKYAPTAEKWINDLIEQREQAARIEAVGEKLRTLKLELQSELKAAVQFIETIGDETDKAVLLPYFTGRLASIEKSMESKE